MGEIRYLNTDLDVWAASDVKPLVNALASRGVCSLHREQARDGDQFAVFETAEDYAAPEENLLVMLAAVESLTGDAAAVWAGGSLREFNIGYACGDRPHGFTHGLSNDVLRRLAAVGATLRVTLYPPEPDDEPAADGGPAVVTSERVPT